MSIFHPLDPHCTNLQLQGAYKRNFSSHFVPLVRHYSSEPQYKKLPKLSAVNHLGPQLKQKDANKQRDEEQDKNMENGRTFTGVT